MGIQVTRRESAAKCDGLTMRFNIYLSNTAISEELT